MWLRRNQLNPKLQVKVTTPRFGLYFLPELTFEKALMFCQSLASAAGGAAQLPTCLFRIQIAKFGLWAGSLPLRGLEPLSSGKISEDHIQDLERLVLRELTSY